MIPTHTGSWFLTLGNLIKNDRESLIKELITNGSEPVQGNSYPSRSSKPPVKPEIAKARMIELRARRKRPEGIYGIVQSFPPNTSPGNSHFHCKVLEVITGSNEPPLENPYAELSVGFAVAVVG